ncbi:MAG: LemA family protein [Verrucomicrobiota bacterium]
MGQVKLDPSHAPTNQADLDKYQAAQNSLGSALSRLLVVSENYPNLRANQNFVDLQAQIEGSENRRSRPPGAISIRRCRDYNTTVQGFPTNIIASFSHFPDQALLPGHRGRPERTGGALRLQHAGHQRRPGAVAAAPLP